MAEKLIRLTQRWRHADGREFRAGWLIVDEDTADDAAEAGVMDTSPDLVPPADYAGMYEQQQAAAKEAAAAERKAKREARKAAAATSQEG